MPTVIVPSVLRAESGGAAQVDEYVAAIERAGLQVRTVRDNPAYAFLSGSALGATRTYGIKSISLLAVKPGGDSSSPDPSETG